MKQEFQYLVKLLLFHDWIILKLIIILRLQQGALVAMS